MFPPCWAEVTVEIASPLAGVMPRVRDALPAGVVTLVDYRRLRDFAWLPYLGVVLVLPETRPPEARAAHTSYAAALRRWFTANHKTATELFLGYLRGPAARAELARPRQHRDMRGRRAFGQRDGAAVRPVGGKKSGRRDVVSRHDRATGNPGDRVHTTQMREHAIADVDDIGGTGTEIFIFSSAIASYLHVECHAPGMVGSDPLRDDLICRFRQRVIQQHDGRRCGSCGWAEPQHCQPISKSPGAQKPHQARSAW